MTLLLLVLGGLSGLVLQAQVAVGKLTPLLGRVWQMKSTPSMAPGTMYVFLPNGTLVMTSCKETYRVATWVREPGHAESLQVTEDGRPSFLIRVLRADKDRLVVRQKMLSGNEEERDITLRLVAHEFVCPGD